MDFQRFLKGLLKDWLVDPKNRIGGNRMPLVWHPSEKFLTYKGVSIFHAYKDDFSDIPLEFWYSTCATAPLWSGYEFDVRQLPGYRPRFDGPGPSEHERVIREAIAAGILRRELSPKVKFND